MNKMIKAYSMFLLSFGMILVNCSQQNNEPSAQGKVSFWLTLPDRSVTFEEQIPITLYSGGNEETPAIRIDRETQYQEMDGFGYTLTGGSAMLLHHMNPQEREKILSELFSTQGTGIGVSYLRVSIGASDLDEYVFSYNDSPPGGTDIDQEHFSIDPDREHLIPVLKEILAISPEIKIMGSPWSAPAWMKTNSSPIGGSLKPEYHTSYALYFVKYIEAMQQEGIPIDAITVQNEPLHPGNNPSMLMLSNQQADFVRNYLGPAFRVNDIKTRIIIYDHNADRIDYPISIMNDTAARKFIDGSAFHLYAGSIEDLSEVHEAHPDKHLYFTEQWIGAPADFGGDLGWHIEHLIIGASRNWCKTVLEWNLAADPNQEPHTDQGGCTRCLGALTIDGDEIVRNPAYYIVAHASKFVRPGSVRIASTNTADNLPNVAFLTPEGTIVLVVLNTDSKRKTFKVKQGGKYFTGDLQGGAAGTYTW